MTFLPEINLPGHRVSASINISDFKCHYNIFRDVDHTVLMELGCCTQQTGEDPGVPSGSTKVTDHCRLKPKSWPPRPCASV